MHITKESISNAAYWQEKVASYTAMRPDDGVIIKENRHVEDSYVEVRASVGGTARHCNEGGGRNTAPTQDQYEFEHDRQGSMYQEKAAQVPS